MSSLFSRPKMPSMDSITYTPITRTSSASAIDTTNNEKSFKDDTDKTDQERINQVLSRHRGRLGTIGTSFRGVLNDSSATHSLPMRKTLLGE